MENFYKILCQKNSIFPKNQQITAHTRLLKMNQKKKMKFKHGQYDIYILIDVLVSDLDICIRFLLPFLHMLGARYALKFIDMRGKKAKKSCVFPFCYEQTNSSCDVSSPKKVFPIKGSKISYFLFSPSEISN